jgi:hypothetical protein
MEKIKQRILDKFQKTERPTPMYRDESFCSLLFLIFLCMRAARILRNRDRARLGYINPDPLTSFDDRCLPIVAYARIILEGST